MDEQMEGTGSRPEPRRALPPRPAPASVPARPEAPLPGTEDLAARIARVDALERRLRTAIATVEEVRGTTERRLDELELQLVTAVAQLEERAAALEASAAALAAARPPRLRVSPPPAAGQTADAVADDPGAAREALVTRVLEVEGIGPARARRVADAFGDLDALLTADAATIAELAALPETAAASILDHVRG